MIYYPKLTPSVYAGLYKEDGWDVSGLDGVPIYLTGIISQVTLYELLAWNGPIALCRSLSSRERRNNTCESSERLRSFR
jgi:hypothetical protein